MTYTPNSAIIGPSSVTQARCVAYLCARPHGAYTEYDVRAIVAGYVRVCKEVGTDLTILIAQLAHETANLSSWWSQRPIRNPAGIGVTGAAIVPRPGTGVWQWNARLNVWCEGCAFPSWADHAIPAHVGRLLAYALPDGAGTEAQQALIHEALRVRGLPHAYRGAAPTLRGLAGRWAVPGTDYPDKLALIANAIVRME
jgi:hypothetical protein